MRTVSAVIVASCVLCGCQPQPEEIATIPEPPVEQVALACVEKPPVVIEVPVPVPMPCQLKPDPVFDMPATRRGKAGRAQPVAARPAARPGINSVQEFAYMPGGLYHVYVAVPNATTILLQPGEFFHQAVIGDKGKWTTSEIAAGSRDGERGGVVVNCSEDGAKSNLTIAASKRVYLLELHCTASTYHAQVSWTYPAEGGVGLLKGARPASVPQQPVAAVMADAPSAAQYTITSNRPVAWLPTHAYDTGVQGKQTVIVFPPELGTAEAPVLYVRTLEGKSAVTNYRVQQGYFLKDRIYEASAVSQTFGGLGEPVTYYVLDQIAAHLELRVGEKKQTVVTIKRHEPGA